MSAIVAKFGGSSLASAGQYRKVAAIIHSEPNRRFVVASAPGKRDKNDTKITDLLYRCYDRAVAGEDFGEVLSVIRERYEGIASELELSFDFGPDFAAIAEHLSTAPQRDYMASRGEYLGSRLLAAYLGYSFVDPALYVEFFEDGILNADKTRLALNKVLSGLSNAVIAGFYGATPDGKVKTFSRGGSDITGSLVAEAIGAELYENWTDVSGMLAADPRIVDNPRPIDYITYQELRELSYMGASVMHEDAVFPVQRAGIPMNIRNTNRPEDPGTMISATLPKGRVSRVVTGVAGRKGFSSIQIEKSMLNAQIGFCAQILQVFASHGVNIEHCPTGIDSVSVITASDAFAPQKNAILKAIRQLFHPDVLLVEDQLSLIAVVGQGLPYAYGSAGRIFSALGNAGINVRMIDQGSSELNIIIGVKEEDYERAIAVIYDAIVK